MRDKNTNTASDTRQLGEERVSRSDRSHLTKRCGLSNIFIASNTYKVNHVGERESSR